MLPFFNKDRCFAAVFFFVIFNKNNPSKIIDAKTQVEHIFTIFE